MTRQCVCGGELEHRDVEVQITTAAGPVVSLSVAQSRCPGCGRRAYTVATLERIEAVMRAAREATPTATAT